MAQSKQQLGQFMTTNYDYILQNMRIPNDTTTIVEPFVGKGDLLKFAQASDSNYTFECYDIQPQCDLAIQRDTLMDPPAYEDKFVLTNPPYLSRNKSIAKAVFDRYDTNDLYKCFLCGLIKDPPLGGIIIIPLNFLSSIRSGDIALRARFLNVFDLIQVNIFEEQVFDDTTYTVCAIQFQTKVDETPAIKIDIYPHQTHIETTLTPDNNYQIGGQIHNLPSSNTYKITRLTRLTEDNPYTNILVKCIDDSLHKQIQLSIVPIDQVYVDRTTNLSARTYATLQIDPPIDNERQSILVDRFNKYLADERKKYNSLFLTNYRESKDIARKRISFGLVYSICESLLDQMDQGL